MPNKNQDSSPRLFRPETNRIIAGVCGGLGEYFNIDPTIIRIIFILLTIFGGSGLLIYLILWIVMPSESSFGPISQETMKGNLNELKTKAKTFAHDIRKGRSKEDSRFWWAVIIIILGFMFLFNNLGIFDAFELRRLWPLILIILGVAIFLRK